MDSVLLSVSSYRWSSGLLSDVEKAGDCESGLIDAGLVWALFARMIAARDKTAFRVEELGAKRVAMSFEDDLLSMVPNFPAPDGGWGHERPWLYTFEVRPGEVNPLYETLSALCHADARLCSPRVSRTIEREAARVSEQIDLLRGALAYYAPETAWMGNTFSAVLPGEHPWRVAQDVLNRSKAAAPTRNPVQPRDLPRSLQVE